MNNLVLLRVVDALNGAFDRAVLRDVRQDDSHRFRFLFDAGNRGGTLIVSLRPERPWIGRPAGRGPRSRPLRQAFAGAVARTLGGAVLAGVFKHPVDRIAILEFADGHRLVAELATHRANLLLLDAAGIVLATARAPRAGRDRQRIGEAYAPPSLPARLLDPSDASAESIDALVEAGIAAGESVADVLRRRVFGLGRESIELLLAEHRGGGRIGAILVRRLADLRSGAVDPVVDVPADPQADPRDPLRSARDGTLDRGALRLWPWPPPDPPPAGIERVAAVDAAGTAGLYHDALENLALVEQRWSALRLLVDRELQKVAAAAAHARRDLEGFSDPERHRRYGEALLAGLSRARVAEGFAYVPDPYAVDGSELAVPVPPGTSLTRAAAAQFERHRRAVRGLERTRQRVGFLDSRRQALAATQARFVGSAGLDDLGAMEQQLRDQRLPVALGPPEPSRPGRATRRVEPARLEGVRVLAGRSGVTILVGKGGRENDRLTFRLAAPEDLWFHAQGCPGAHVVVRAPGGARIPAPQIVQEAAAVAAWYSEARGDGQVDVQWTRRKYVRRRRGAAPGAVVIKKFQTVRVRPALPPQES